MNGDYVTSIEELDTRSMDSVWLAIKTSWKMNDDGSYHGLSFLTTIDHMSVLRYRLMGSLREDNVNLPYVRMKL
ncbi:hypothetical protein AgCh_009969 [Apium graveolens]